jgi:hypothetical protein
MRCWLGEEPNCTDVWPVGGSQQSRIRRLSMPGSLHGGTQRGAHGEAERSRSGPCMGIGQFCRIHNVI